MISSAAFPTGYMNDIVLNPDNGNELMLIFSNYSIKSIYYTPDSGVTWTDISGNLEQYSSGSGNGPSVRCGAILPLPDGKLYFVGTSTGLYFTDTIQGTSTIWTHIGVATIGNNVVETMTYRQTDGLLVIGTHGSGIFSTKITSMSQFLSVRNQLANDDLLLPYPNPTTDMVYFQPTGNFQLIEILDLNGKRQPFKISQNSVSLKKYNNGVYLFVFKNECDRVVIKKIVKNI